MSLFKVLFGLFFIISLTYLSGCSDAVETVSETAAVNTTYSVGGSIIIDPNLLSQLKVAVNGVQIDTLINGSNEFMFGRRFGDGAVLELSFLQFPEFQSCTVNGGETYSVTVSGGDVKTINIECSYDTPLITIQPMNFNADKRNAFTTPNIFDYINDIEVGENPSVVQWNLNVVAQHGSVTYNGNGTFTYIPNEFMPSGVDSFSFVVSNSNSTHAQGLISLNISKGWDSKHDFNTELDTYNVIKYITLGSDSVLESRGSFGYQIRKLDKDNHTWLAPKNLSLNWKMVVDINAQNLKFFDIVSSETESVLTIGEYTVSNDTLGAPVELEKIAAGRLSIQGVIVDDHGNIFVLMFRLITDANNFSYYEYWGKYYSVIDQSWQPAAAIFDGTSNSPYATQSMSMYLVNGKPTVFFGFLTDTPSVFEYVKLDNSWAEKKLSNAVLSPVNGFVSPVGYAVNAAGDVAINWYQSETDPQTGEIFNVIRANIYSATTGSLQGEQLIQSVSTSYALQLKIVVLNSSDFLFMWETTPTGLVTYDIFARTYNTKTQSYDATPTTLLAGYQDSLIWRRFLRIDKNGNTIFPYSTKDVYGKYLHFFKALPYRGVWSTEQQVNEVAFLDSYLLFNFDSIGNYYSIYYQGNINGGFLNARKYDFSLGVNSSIIPIDADSVAKTNSGFVSSNSRRLFVYWTKQNTFAQDELCLREIALSVGFSGNDLSNEICMVVPNPISGQKFSVHVLEDNDKNMSLFIATDNVYFANQNAGVWSGLQTIFTGKGNPYYNILDIQQYGARNAMSLTVQHSIDFSDSYGQITTKSTLFNFLYN